MREFLRRQIIRHAETCEQYAIFAACHRHPVAAEESQRRAAAHAAVAFDLSKIYMDARPPWWARLAHKISRPR